MPFRHCITIKIGVILTLFLSSVSYGNTNSITLPEFIAHIQTTHPYIQQEQIQAQIQTQKKIGTKGDYDWHFETQPFVTGETPYPMSSFTPKKQSSFGINTQLKKTIWETGGELSFTAKNSKTNQTLPSGLDFDLGPSTLYQNEVGVQYSHPLSQNRDGLLSQQNYKKQVLLNAQVQLQSEENIEAFLLEMSHHYLNWVFLSEQVKLTKKRHELAQKSYTQIKKKYQNNLVDKVDLLRAESAVKSSKQQHLISHSNWRAKQAELSILSQHPIIKEQSPDYDIGQQHPNLTRYLSHIDTARPLHYFTLLENHLKYEEKLSQNEDKPLISLNVTHLFKGGSESLRDSTSFIYPESTLSIDYNAPIEKTKETATLKTIELSLAQIKLKKKAEKLRLNASTHYQLIQIHNLEKILQINRTQITLAKSKTIEERRTYNQGRNPLSTLIQAEENELNIQLTYLQNALSYQTHVLEYLALTDQLIPTLKKDSK